MRTFLTTLAFSVLAALPASAVTIAAYDTVNGAAISADLVADDVTALDLTRGSALREAGNANQFRTRRWGTRTTARNPATTNRYIEWGFSSTQMWDLEEVSIAYNRNDNGPQAFAIFASFDGGAYTEVFTDTAVSTSIEIANISLSGVEASSATFRLVAWNAVDNSGRFLIRKNRVGPGNDYGIAISGSLTVVPLPASMPLLAGGVLLLGLSRRRARRT